MGPTTRSITVTRNVGFEELRDGYLPGEGALEGGADILLLETCNDTRNVKAALLGIERLEQESAKNCPSWCRARSNRPGTMLAGQTADAFYASIGHKNLLSVSA
jgi:5-methyltetrahydrofolate--homocysteine methyltransferase